MRRRSSASEPGSREDLGAETVARRSAHPHSAAPNVQYEPGGGAPLVCTSAAANRTAEPTAKACFESDRLEESARLAATDGNLKLK